MGKRTLRPRKLLVASTGVMTVSYLLACSRTSSVAGEDTMGTNGETPVGDMSDVRPNESAGPMLTSVVANLPAPPVYPTVTPVTPTQPPIVGNLVPYPNPTVYPTAYPTVANLVAPTVEPMPTLPPTSVPDAAVTALPDSGLGDADAAVDGGSGGSPGDASSGQAPDGSL